MDDVVNTPAVTTTFTIYTDCFWVNDEYVEKELDVKYLPLIQKYIVTDKAYDALLMKIDFDGYSRDTQSQHPYYDTLALLEEELEGIRGELYDAGVFGNEAKYFFRSTWRLKDVPTLQLKPEEDDTEYDADEGEILRRIRESITKKESA